MIGTAKLQVIWRVWKTCRKLCHEMINQHGIDRFRSVTGLPVSTYFSAFKVKWLLDNVAEVSSAMAEGDAMIGTVDTWLIYNLTGGVGKGSHVTDGVAHCLDQLCKAASRMHRVSPDAHFCPPRTNVRCSATLLPIPPSIPSSWDVRKQQYSTCLSLQPTLSAPPPQMGPTGRFCGTL